MIFLQSNFVESVLDLACTIQQIPGPTFQETKRAAFMFEQFNALGLLDVITDSAGNVLGRLPGTGSARPLVVSAHLDTVHPLGTPLTLQQSTDRIIGPSIGDNSLGLAGLLALPRMLARRQVTLPGDLWLAANVAEEGLGNLVGMQAIVDRFGSQPLAYIVIEGMGLGNILHRGLGVERYKITVQTPGGHSWADFGLPSAIHELCILVNRLTSLPLPLHPCTTLNVGIIQGGTSVNTIAGQAWLELDLRSEDSQALTHLVNQVHQVVRSSNRPNVETSLAIIGKRQAGSLSVTHPLVELAQQVIGEIGMEAHLDIASTDANLPLSRNYPSICVGLTLGNNAHAKDEFILTSPVEKGMHQLFELVTRTWQVMQ
jgi:acetylornithine deacetylase/succinyl-diaminopimelate desuccinylase-like protein